jgi:hypothetical protein
MLSGASCHALLLASFLWALLRHLPYLILLSRPAWMMSNQHGAQAFHLPPEVKRLNWSAREPEEGGVVEHPKSQLELGLFLLGNHSLI